MRTIGTVFAKEFRDGRRDNRAVMSAFLFPILAPILIYAMMSFLIERRNQSVETVIPVMGAENAPSLIRWLKERDVKIEPFEGDPREAVRTKAEELVVIIPDNFEERFAETRTAVIEIVNDGSRTDTVPTFRRIRDLVYDYNHEIAALRLITRGVLPDVMRVVKVEDIDIASKQQQAVAALNFLPMYIILAAFVSGMGIAVDSTAGERERKTLEPLLINPVQRHDIVFGKLLTASLFSSTGAVLTFVLCIVALLQVPLDQVGLNFHISIQQIVLVSCTVLPVAFLASSLQMMVGIFAKSFKDAQSYIGILTIVPMIPSFFLMLNPVATQEWMYAVPIMGQHIIVVDVLGMKETPTVGYIYSILSSMVLATGCALITARLFQRETII